MMSLVTCQLDKERILLLVKLSSEFKRITYNLAKKAGINLDGEERDT